MGELDDIGSAFESVPRVSGGRGLDGDSAPLTGADNAVVTEQRLLGDPEGAGDSKMGSGSGGEHRDDRYHYMFAAFLIVGYILGTGVLVLPYAMVKLGYVMGFAVSLLFALISSYIGVLMGRLRNDFFPQCLSYKMLARHCVGPRLESALEFLTCINWFMSMALYILTAVKAFEAATGTRRWMCVFEWGLVAVALLVPTLCLTNLKSIEWLATASDAAAILILCLVLGLLASEGGAAGASSRGEHSVWPPGDTPFLDAYNSISAFLFAYQGQSIFLEVMAEMREPRQWPLSIYLSHTIMATCYSITAFVGYYYLGDAAPAFLPAVLREGWLKTVVNLLLAFHVLVAYVINNIPLCAMLKRRYLKGAETPLYQHYALSLAMLAFAWLLTNVIPFFADMVSIIGALCGSPIMMGLPPLFYFRAMRAAGRRLSWADALLCALLFFLMFPFTFVAGLIAAFKSLVDNWQHNSAPFQCEIG